MTKNWVYYFNLKKKLRYFDSVKVCVTTKNNQSIKEIRKIFSAKLRNLLEMNVINFEEIKLCKLSACKI